MPDFNLVVKIIISAAILYLVVNSVFKYHVYNDLFFFSLLFFGLVVLIYYIDIEYNIVFPILLGIITVVFIGLHVYFKTKKIRYFFILNADKLTYHRIKYYLMLNEVDSKLYTYSKKYRFILKFKGIEEKRLKNIMKGIETQESKRKISFNICNYWLIILFVVMMIILWRF